MNNIHYFCFHLTDNSRLIDVITEMNILNKMIMPFVRFAIKLHLHLQEEQFNDNKEVHKEIERVMNDLRNCVFHNDIYMCQVLAHSEKEIIKRKCYIHHYNDKKKN